MAEIRVRSFPDYWRHFPGQKNLADVLSRRLGIQELLTNSLWWKEPSWLSQEPSVWPESSVFFDETLQLEVKEETIVLLEKDQEGPSLFDTRIYDNYRRFWGSLSGSLGSLTTLRREMTKYKVD